MDWWPAITNPMLGLSLQVKTPTCVHEGCALVRAGEAKATSASATTTRMRFKAITPVNGCGNGPASPPVRHLSLRMISMVNDLTLQSPANLLFSFGWTFCANFLLEIALVTEFSAICAVKSTHI